MAKRSNLTDAQKARNVANGLTPTGRVRQKRLSRKGMDKLPDYPPGDYRSLGVNFTPARKNAFLDIIREKGLTSAACAEIGLSPCTVSRHRSEDPQFRDAMDEAFRQHGASLIREAHRRGVEGVSKPIYGSQGPGQGSGVVGWVQEYSDRLLLELLRKYDPDFRPATAKVEVTTNVSAPKGDSNGLSLEDLSPESQEDLLRIIEREKSRRASDGEAEQG